jgi:hypothetical protein
MHSMLALSGIALLLADEGEAERAVEVCARAAGCVPSVAEPVQAGDRAMDS